MVKTKGGGSQGDRLRSTASVRRRRRHVNEDEEHVEHEDAEHVEPEEAELHQKTFSIFKYDLQ